MRNPLIRLKERTRTVLIENEQCFSLSFLCSLLLLLQGIGKSKIFLQLGYDTAPYLKRACASRPQGEKNLKGPVNFPFNF